MLGNPRSLFCPCLFLFFLRAFLWVFVQSCTTLGKLFDKLYAQHLKAWEGGRGPPPPPPQDDGDGDDDTGSDFVSTVNARGFAAKPKKAKPAAAVAAATAQAAAASSSSSPTEQPAKRLKIVFKMGGGSGGSMQVTRSDAPPVALFAATAAERSQSQQRSQSPVPGGGNRISLSSLLGRAAAAGDLDDDAGLQLGKAERAGVRKRAARLAKQRFKQSGGPLPVTRRARLKQGTATHRHTTPQHHLWMVERSWI